MNTPYYLDSPFVDERARYLAQMLERGWARETVIGTAGRLVGFARRVDITAAGGVTATQIEAAAAKEAADTAKRQLTLAEETLRTSQRAYVGLRDHPKLLRPILDGTNPTIEIRFFNAGNTPARDVEFRYKFQANGVEKPYIAPKGNFTIFAGATKTILCRWNGQTFSDETQQWFKDGYYQLFFRGKLTYKDVWGVQQEPIRFYYFSINDMDLREDYEGDPDYASPDFEVEIDPDEEVTYTTDDPFPEPEEANKDPFDF